MKACRALLSGGAPAGDPGTGEWAAAARMLGGSLDVPIYVGAMSPRMLGLAGELADGVLALLYPPEHYPVAVAQVRAGAERAGRDLASIGPARPVCGSRSTTTRRAPSPPLAEKLAYYGPAFAPYLLERAGLPAGAFAPAAAALAAGHRAEALALITPGDAGPRHRRHPRYGRGALPGSSPGRRHAPVLRTAARAGPCRGGRPARTQGLSPSLRLPSPY